MDSGAAQRHQFGLPAHGKLLAWELEKVGNTVKVRVEGQGSTAPRLRAALEGYGQPYLPQDIVQQDIADENLIKVLEDCCPTFPGYRLSYSSHRQSSPAFVLIVDALRHQD